MGTDFMPRQTVERSVEQQFGKRGSAPPEMKTVLFLISNKRPSTFAKLAGLRRYAKSSGWRLQMADLTGNWYWLLAAVKSRGLRPPDVLWLLLAQQIRIGTQICLHVPFKIPVERCRIEIVKQGRCRDGDVLAG